MLPNLEHRAGEPQRIGLTDTCVVIAERDWVGAPVSDLGAWLVAPIAASALVHNPAAPPATSATSSPSA